MGYTLFALLLVFFTSAAHAECQLAKFYEDNLFWDRNTETKIDYFRRVRHLTYVDVERLKSKYLNLNKESGNQEYLNQFGDLDDYINYTKHQKIRMLTIHDRPTPFSENCAGNEGVLKLKLNISFADMNWSRTAVYFKKVEGEWMLDNSWPALAVEENKFDGGSVYTSWGN